MLLMNERMKERMTMQTSNRVLDDLAKVAGGAVSALSGVKQELESQVRSVLEKIMTDADMVAREEFDAIKAIAIKARRSQEKLELRVQELEKRVASKAAKKTTTKKAAKPRIAKK